MLLVRRWLLVGRLLRLLHLLLHLLLLLWIVHHLAVLIHGVAGAVSSWFGSVALSLLLDSGRLCVLLGPAISLGGTVLLVASISLITCISLTAICLLSWLGLLATICRLTVASAAVTCLAAIR